MLFSRTIACACRRASQCRTTLQSYYQPRSEYHTKNADDLQSRVTQSKLREILRETAQPVAVITSWMPPSSSHEGDGYSKYHGATLSSFTSVAMDPYPLVSFALRIPSRMGATLKSLYSDPRPGQEFGGENSAHLVMNLLSASQACAAHKFARPDLYPHPFDSSSNSAKSENIPYFVSKDGLPVLEGSLGAFSCRLVAPAIPLHDLSYLVNLGQAHTEPRSLPRLPPGSVISELFIAQVMRIELESPSPSIGMEPLLYHRRSFTSCKGDESE
ncbi:hypothetical protein BDN71DRAFT_127525 [Pleurotus eryngii]|uniref:Flavin reductase like domain-containing protein n=1 Tax=Pleurotus eryngii TaxID=5323 RepID=A0A9P6A5H7_PLEER|nr:hypothetical protein BDN71DRAFT_127525 [Pleurotus eryngii]